MSLSATFRSMIFQTIGNISRAFQQIRIAWHRAEDRTNCLACHLLYEVQAPVDYVSDKEINSCPFSLWNRFCTPMTYLNAVPASRRLPPAGGRFIRTRAPKKHWPGS